jgi:serine/threonine protein kinase
VNQQDALPELVSPNWQFECKLIGYGMFSLVFRPAFFMPNPQIFDVPLQVLKDPAGFVGLICTQEHFEKKIRKSIEILKAVLFKDFRTLRPIFLPIELSGSQDSLLLRNEQVQTLMQTYHAVRKKVEYEKSWEDQPLVQAMFPYGGIPLAELEKKPERAPSWAHFFEGMCEVTSFLIHLHNEGYVHGDLSPNNLLYKETDDSHFEFSIVDWTMLSEAREFLKHPKGRTRVGCWPPEHFALTTARLEDIESDRHWLIYADEMQKYITRSLEFSFSSQSDKAPELRRYFELFQDSKQTMFQTLYADLKNLAALNPLLIGKYHDIRYLMDTIAKCVASIFPNRTQEQQKQYNSFIALYLAQNLPDRKIYLENPDQLFHRLRMVLQNCSNAESKSAPSSQKIQPHVQAEETLLNLLNE